MKTKYLFLTVLLLTFTLIVPNAYAQDYTKWHLPEGAKARLGKGQITGGIAFSPDGSLLAVASSIGIWIYNAQSGKELDLLIGHTASVNGVAFSPDGHLIVSGSEDRTVCVWDASTGQHLKTFTTDHVHGVGKVAFSPDSRSIATNGGFFGAGIQLWNTVSGTRNETLLGGPFSFNRNGQTIATGVAGAIFLWDVVSGSRKKTLTGPNSEITVLVFSPNGRFLASGHDFPTSLNLWDAATGVHLRTITNHSLLNVKSLVFSPDSRTLVSGGALGKINLWGRCKWDTGKGTQRT